MASVALLLTVAFLSFSSLTTEAQTRRFTYKGETRSVIIDAPGTAGPRPAVILLHGGAGTPRQIRRFVGLEATARGWVLVVPEGLDRSWNDGRTARGGTPIYTRDDAGFLASLVNTLATEGIIDRRNVFMTGISNGGFMALRMLCDFPGLLAGAAVVKAGQPVGLDCDRPKPTPLMFFFGTEDKFVPFAGGPVAPGNKDRGLTLSAGETLTKWAHANRCRGMNETRLPDVAPDDQTRVQRLTFTGCTAPLVQYIIKDGGHGWPGRTGARLVRRILGPTTMDIDANALMLDYFAANKR